MDTPLNKSQDVQLADKAPQTGEIAFTPGFRIGKLNLMNFNCGSDTGNNSYRACQLNFAAGCRLYGLGNRAF